VEKEFHELYNREINLDIKISPFIKDRYKQERLFWTFNHPSVSVLLKAAKMILETLYLPDDLPSKWPKEFLDNTVYPILPSVRASLGLDFSDVSPIRIRDRDFSLTEIIEKYYSFYGEKPDLWKIKIHQNFL
jgi:hypothetical protein